MVRVKVHHLKKVSKDCGAGERGVSPYLSIVTLNINRLNSSIKRHRMAEWIKKIKIQQRDSLFTIDSLSTRLTLGLRIHINQEQRDGKRNFKQMLTKRK